MMSQPDPLQTTRYADHLRGCADLAKEIASRIDIRDDSARQACLATIIISADRHNLFLEPVPRDTKTPVKENGNRAAAKDEAAAQKADAQIQDMPRNPTPEQAEDAKLTVLRDGVNKVRAVLNAEGYDPPLTPERLTALIKTDMQVEGGLEVLGVDELDLLLKTLTRTLDNFRHNKKALEADAPF